MRSPCVATDPYPAPRVVTCHNLDGPDAGHFVSRPVSFDRPVRSGPRHCGQSVGAGAWLKIVTVVNRRIVGTSIRRLIRTPGKSEAQKAESYRSLTQRQKAKKTGRTFVR